MPRQDQNEKHIARVIRRCLENGTIQWRKHAHQRMLERGIDRKLVVETLKSGECIKEYADDTPYPSALFLGWQGKMPIHIVAASDADAGIVYIITVYVPDPKIFSEDFRKRRKE
jgi:hypothetical protein